MTTLLTSPAKDSDTLGAVSPPNVPADSALARYGRLWRNVPRELGFLVLTMPIALVGFVVTVALFPAGIGTIVTFFIGIFLIAATLYVSRAFGLLELTRLEWAGRPAIIRPDWKSQERPGFFGWLRSLFANGHYWLYTLHTMVVNFAISLITWTIMVTWVSVALSGVTFWFWQWSIDPGTNWHFASWLLTRNGFAEGGAGLIALDILSAFLVGLVFLATLPFVTRGLVLLHDVIARVMLGAFRSESLEREVVALSASRGAAVAAEGQSLRRLERDLHDGPQQRLVRLQMDLASADRQLDANPEQARVLIAEAMAQSKDALEELRALSRGFAPPILQDRGLVAALESLIVRSAVPVTFVNELPADAIIPPDIERNAYFVASELLTNVAKHASASNVELQVGTRTTGSGSSGTQSWLDIMVTDDGEGGAKSPEGHGLAGLAERLHGLGGDFSLRSPSGGPTIAVARLPLGE
ncbi:sensor histidine kinase [soil metagenome]